MVGLLACGAFIFEVSELPRQQREASGWVAHTLEVLGTARDLTADLATAASEERGFVVDKEDETRRRFDASAKKIDHDMVVLRALTGDNAQQQNAIARLESLIDSRLAVLRSIMDQSKAGAMEGAIRGALLHRDRGLMDQVLDAVEDLKAEEEGLLPRRSEMAQHAARQALWGLVACAILVVTSGLITVSLLAIRQRERKHFTELRFINADLERRVDARTAELATSEANFRMLAEHASDMVTRVGPDGTRFYVSPASARIFGVSPELLVGRDVLTMIHGEDVAATSALQAGLLAGRVAQGQITFRVLNPDRGEVWAEAAVQSMRQPETGALDGYISVLRDVTDRKAAEQALRMSEARYRLLADSSSDVIVCLSLALSRTYVSPACELVFGYRPEEMLGGAPADIMHPDDLAGFQAVIGPLIEGKGERGAYTYRGRHKHGHWIWIEAIASLVRHDATGEPDSFVCSLRDISERKAQADKISAANKDLERFARHLARARDRAEQATKAKSRFLAGMSHELRTPLNGILGYAQLLQLDGGLTTMQAARVEAMIDVGTHLLAMITYVLDLSEIEAEHIELRPVAFDLHGLAQGCLDLLRPAADAKALALRLVADHPKPWTVTADPTRLRQLLLNLLGNAVKFTAQGSVELRLRPTPDLAGLRIEVADTGPGISADDRPRLFGDFARLGGVGAGKVEGAGLGLALSARLASAMGGCLGYDDQHAGGSVFWLELPIASGATEAVSSLPPCVADLSLAEPARALRVLVVDDVAMNRDIAGAFLQSAGHDVAFAEGGLQAVEIVATTEFDVVLMDVRMPEMDGLEATRRIRALPGPCARVPVVALTAQAFAEQIAHCREAGMDGHLAKPFTFDELTEAVASAAASGHVDDPAPASATAAPAARSRVVSDLSVGLPVFNHVVFERTTAYLAPEATASHLLAITGRAEALLSDLRRSHALASDALGLADAAHMLAGSAGMFGFEHMTAAARLFERTIRSGDPSEMGAAPRRLATAIEASLPEMAMSLRHHAKVAEPATVEASPSPARQPV